MEILVCIKQVPGTTQVEIDPKTGTLKRDGVESKMNPFDLYALETALRLKAKHGCMLCAAGEEIPGHEFHHWDCEHTGDGFTAQKESGRRWDCVVSTDRLYAGFPHFHFYANPAFAANFYETCLKEKKDHD